MDYRTIEYTVEPDGLLLLTLARPEKLNAFTVKMCEELIDAYGRASRDDAVRVIVVTGSGRAFCAGMDLGVGGNVFGLTDGLSPTLPELRERFDDPEIVNGVRDTGGRVALAMYDCLKPIVGAVNGVAVGSDRDLIAAYHQDHQEAFGDGLDHVRGRQRSGVAFESCVWSR